MFVATSMQRDPRKWTKADFRLGRVLTIVRQRFPQCANWGEDDLLRSTKNAASRNLLAAAFLQGLCIVASEPLLFCFAVVSPG